MKASLGRWIIKKYPNDPVKYVNRIQEYYSDFDKESVRYWDDVKKIIRDNSR